MAHKHTQKLLFPWILNGNIEGQIHRATPGLSQNHTVDVAGRSSIGQSTIYLHFLEARSRRARHIRFWEASNCLCPLLRGQRADHIRFWEASNYLCPFLRGQRADYIRFWEACSYQCSLLRGQRADYIRFWEACNYLCPLLRGQRADYIRFWEACKYLCSLLRGRKTIQGKSLRDRQFMQANLKVSDPVLKVNVSS